MWVVPSSYHSVLPDPPRELLADLGTSVETMPGDETIARYAELGGSAVPLGSDAHRPQEVGAGFERAVEMLRKTGLQVAVYVKRERTCVAV